MRRGSIFWGLLLVFIGFLILLDNLGIFANVNIWNLIWPFFLILLGVWFLIGALSRQSTRGERVAIPLEGANRARLRINHGVGRLRVYSDRTPDHLIVGDFSGGIDYQSRREGENLDVRMRLPGQLFPFFWFPGGSLDWSFSINPDIPLDLEIEAGANDSRIDLSNMQIYDLHLKSGASSTELILPSSAGFTRARVESGVASVKIEIPHGVAASIRSHGGLSSVNIDRARFPRSGNVFRSEDYETSNNRVELDIEMGVGSVTVS
jgi:hypothetical protein